MNHSTTAAFLAVLAALAGCATEAPTQDAVVTDCTRQEPRTGTLIVRKNDCEVSTPESRDAARRQLEAMQQEQERLRVNKRQAGGG